MISYRTRVIRGTVNATRIETHPNGYVHWNVLIDEPPLGLTDVNEPFCRHDGKQVRITIEYLDEPIL